MEIHHIIYSAVPYKGYAVRAWSSREVVGEIEQAVKGWFSPFEQALVRPSTELRAVVKSPRGFLLLIRVFLGEKLDELKRSGVVSHIALIPLDVAIERKLSLSRVEKVMMDHIASKGVEIGEMEPLKIEIGGQGIDEDLEYLKTVVNPATASKILAEVSKQYNKLVVIHKRDQWFRTRLAYGLAKMLAIHGLGEYLISTEKPNDSVLIEFEKTVLVLYQIIPLSRSLSWSVVKIDEKQEETPGEIKKTIDKIYGVNP
jgi:hypothetical protein